MNRTFACVLLSLGTVLLVYSLNALRSLSAALSHLFSGLAPEPALWFLLAGLVAFGAGFGGLCLAPKGRRIPLRR